MACKKSQTQQILEDIMVRYNCKDITEAQAIYRKKYEQDIELDPNKIPHTPDKYERKVR